MLAWLCDKKFASSHLTQRSDKQCVTLIWFHLQCLRAHQSISYRFGEWYLKKAHHVYEDRNVHAHIYLFCACVLLCPFIFIHHLTTGAYMFTSRYRSSSVKETDRMGTRHFIVLNFPTKMVWRECLGMASI